MRVTFGTNLAETFTTTRHARMIIHTISMVLALLSSFLLDNFAVTSICARQPSSALVAVKTCNAHVQTRTTPVWLASEIVIITTDPIIDLWSAGESLVRAPLSILIAMIRQFSLIGIRIIRVVSSYTSIAKISPLSYVAMATLALQFICACCIVFQLLCAMVFSDYLIHVFVLISFKLAVFVASTTECHDCTSLKVLIDRALSLIKVIATWALFFGACALWTERCQAAILATVGGLWGPPMFAALAPNLAHRQVNFMCLCLWFLPEQARRQERHC